MRPRCRHDPRRRDSLPDGSFQEEENACLQQSGIGPGRQDFGLELVPRHLDQAAKETGFCRLVGCQSGGLTGIPRAFKMRSVCSSTMWTRNPPCFIPGCIDATWLRQN
jgi:hypothetical protein